MAISFKKYFYKEHYSFQEIIRQISMLKQRYSDTYFQVRKNHRTIDTYITLKPTEESYKYKLRISANIGSTIVNVYPIDPFIGQTVNGKKVPHMYSDGALCLFYPDYNEWKYTDSWADTLVPWTCLWLYYYEIWLITGEWLGGGIHGSSKTQYEA